MFSVLVLSFTTKSIIKIIQNVNNCPSSSVSGNKLPIQLPTQPVPMVNGVVRGTEHSQIITSSVGSVIMGGGAGAGMTLTQSQAGTSQVATVAAAASQPTQQYIAIDPATGINYKVDMALTSELGSDPLAAIMNETIFQDTSGAIVPGTALTHLKRIGVFPHSKPFYKTSRQTKIVKGHQNIFPVFMLCWFKKNTTGCLFD